MQEARHLLVSLHGQLTAAGSRAYNELCLRVRIHDGTRYCPVQLYLDQQSAACHSSAEIPRRTLRHRQRTKLATLRAPASSPRMAHGRDSVQATIWPDLVDNVNLCFGLILGHLAHLERLLSESTGIRACCLPRRHVEPRVEARAV